MALWILSTGTEFALACLIKSPRRRLAFGSSDPPCLTAMMIFFPYTAFVLAFLASVFAFVLARTAAALPMNKASDSLN
eukprot:CAMPEP_0168793004 /NCGR_PEP_ID=MMETSP0725-20121227/14843_1 /TAXON_ID=265536 /ORGANISM="Amphiprora sp., Strain CCMP467" /LENGTH=77 /DNA_ID=CAMNT_0008843729 /DNA_START=175 /DNA_END=405 /DNA_ORIENTATION=-